MKEPDYMCPLIDKVQNDLAQMYEKLKDEEGFQEEGEHWDIIMACLYNLENIRIKIEGLREWGRLQKLMKHQLTSLN